MKKNREQKKTKCAFLHRATYRTGRVDRALLDVIDEGNVVARVPIQRVEHRVEVHRIQELVYRVNHLLGGEKKRKPLNVYH